MGQYYVTVNLDKQEYFTGDVAGAKLWEIAHNLPTAQALAALLANSNGRGGGDLMTPHPLIGHWAGDRIVIAGDYATPDDPGEDGTKPILYARCNGINPDWLDITVEVKELVRLWPR